MKISLGKKTIIILEIFIVAFIILCMYNVENFQSSEGYIFTQGICRSRDTDNKLTETPNYHIIDYNNTQDPDNIDENTCNNLCTQEPNCLGYSQNITDKKCHLYGQQYTNVAQGDIQGTATKLDQGNIQENNQFNCFVKKNNEPKQTIAAINAASLASNIEAIENLKQNLIDKQDIENRLILQNNEEINKLFGIMVDNLSHSTLETAYEQNYDMYDVFERYSK